MIKFDCQIEDLSPKALLGIIADCLVQLSNENLVGLLVKIQLLVIRRVGGLPNEHN